MTDNTSETVNAEIKNGGERKHFTSKTFTTRVKVGKSDGR